MGNFFFYRRGQMTLPFVLLIGGIIVEVVIAGAVVTFFLSNSNYGERLSLRASTVAQSGISDALLKITNNKNYIATDNTTTTYSLSNAVSNDVTEVSISRFTENGKYRYNIISLGTALNRQKKYVVRAWIDDTTGYLELESIKDVVVE